MKKVIGLILLLVNVSLFAGLFDGPGTGGTVKHNPIDTNEIILIVAAVLLTVGVVAYRKLSIKKA